MQKKKFRYDELPGLFDDLDLPPVPEIKPMEPVKSAGGKSLYFMSFGSGSSGNCSFVSDGNTGILIDAGVDPDNVFKSLLHCGVTPDMIKGICITHDHGDHIRFVYSIVRKYKHIAVYCTPKCFSGIMRRHNISRRLKDYHHPIYKEFPFTIGDMELTAFEVSHDGTDNAGYFISFGDHTFAIATDLGCITDRVDHYMNQARYIMIEANYDNTMLRTGTYSEMLKSRIAAYNGHLDNKVTADFLTRIYRPDMRAVFLCHLSNDNNTPEIALRTVSDSLLHSHPNISIGDGSESFRSRESALQLVALPRYDASPLYRFR